MSNQHLIDEIHDDLLSAGIHRTDAQIDGAIMSAADGWRDQEGWWVDPESIRRREDAWHAFLHAPLGVYDLLEIDVEDENRLYDREPQLVGAPG